MQIVRIYQEESILLPGIKSLPHFAEFCVWFGKIQTPISNSPLIVCAVEQTEQIW